MCITSSHSSRCKVRCAEDYCRTRCWDGQKTKLPPPAEKLKWTPLVQLQRWISNSFVNLAFKARKEIVVSLPNFLCILISRSLSNLKLKYKTVFKHKRIHNFITHSKVSRNTMAADAGNPPQLQTIITSHTVCSMHVRSRWCTAHRCNNFDFGFIWWLLVC